MINSIVNNRVLRHLLIIEPTSSYSSDYQKVCHRIDATTKRGVVATERGITTTNRGVDITKWGVDITK